MQTDILYLNHFNCYVYSTWFQHDFWQNRTKETQRLFYQSLYKVIPLTQSFNYRYNESTGVWSSCQGYCARANHVVRTTARARTSYLRAQSLHITVYSLQHTISSNQRQTRSYIQPSSIISYSNHRRYQNRAPSLCSGWPHGGVYVTWPLFRASRRRLRGACTLKTNRIRVSNL